MACSTAESIGKGAMVRAGSRLLVLGGNTDLREKNSVVFSLEEDQQEWREEGRIAQQHVFFSALCVRPSQVC